MSYFHIYNRGLDKRIIFPDETYYDRFLVTTLLSRLKQSPKPTVYFKQMKLGLLPDGDKRTEELWGPPLVDILSYCLMPNHFHFLLKERIVGGVTKFTQRLADGYTKYFNIRHEREGRLFTASYKSVRIQGDEQLIQVSRYIHLNPTTSSHMRVPISQLKNFPWSSLSRYLENNADLLCQPEEIAEFFSSPKAYWKFVQRDIGETLEFPKEVFIDTE